MNLQDAPPPLSAGAKVLRVGVIGVALATLAGGFAYAGGWLSPQRLSPEKFTAAFEHSDGLHEGFRRNHAKGVCVTGTFESNGAGTRLSKASVFRAGTTPVVGRFSVGGGNPYIDDAAATVRGLGLQFVTADGQTWRTGMVSVPVFPVSTPQAFHDLLVASAPVGDTGKPDPAKIGAFVSQHPELVAATTIIKSQPPVAGFADTTFHGLNAFRFIGPNGETPVRWEFVPETATPSTPAATQPHDPNALFDGIIASIAKAPVRWHLIVIIGQPGDPTNDANKMWPADRERVDVGTLTLDRVLAEADTSIADLNFDPLVLPDGIAPSDDPLLSARSAAYMKSLRLRAGETGKKAASAITPADVQKGGTH